MKFLRAVGRDDFLEGFDVPMAVEISDVQRRAEEMMAKHGFLGIPARTFEDAGRRQFVSLLQAGLRPESRVLDLGCGVLRVGYWLIRFLEPDRYRGIEPVRDRVECGLRYILDPDEVARKRPRFDHTPDFDFSVFGEAFDFVLAGSIWSHASKAQIATSLDSFVSNSRDGAVFLASYIRAERPEDDYRGDRWVGTSHESTAPGIVRHAFSWIEEQCRARDLGVRELPGEAFDGQVWLRVDRSGGLLQG